MPNLMVTNKCNLACSYCFGVEQMHPRMQKEYMSKEVFCSLLDWLKQSNENYFHIMGGEPTQHPEFIWMLEISSKMSFVVDIFSNGITDFSPEELETVRRLSRTWIVNVNDPQKYTPIISAKLESLLQSLGEQVVLTFNIINTNYDPNYLFGYINKY
ncbi:MAG TPA: radical SAM protein, partial [candidate division Zixibacteria bacterium]|nr:radical SAM protein [candidate division Zixibacteria bacterium]